MAAAAPAALFNSLSQHSRRWTLTRKLRSDNPADLNGELKGIATFTLLPPRPQGGGEGGGPVGGGLMVRPKEMLYREEGEMPSLVKAPGMAGLKWTKKYIWRLNGEEGNGNTDDPLGMSVWFVKASTRKQQQQQQQKGNEEDEADYLFHEFDFEFYKDPCSSPSPGSGIQQQLKTPINVENTSPSKDQDNRETETSIAPPVPPPVPFLQQQQPAVAEKTTILNARGHHLCINDLYQTAYSFRIRTDTGEVLSWASRHVVKGPKKNQDIMNLYERESGD